MICGQQQQANHPDSRACLFIHYPSGITCSSHLNDQYNNKMQPFKMVNGDITLKRKTYKLYKVSIKCQGKLHVLQFFFQILKTKSCFTMVGLNRLILYFISALCISHKQMSRKSFGEVT